MPYRPKYHLDYRPAALSAARPVGAAAPSPTALPTLPAGVGFAASGAWGGLGLAGQQLSHQHQRQRLRAAEPASLQRLAGQSMGTHWRLVVDNPSYLPLAHIRQAVQAVLDQIIADMSHWQPDSALSRFNQAPAGSWLHLPEDLSHVLSAGLDWAQRSQGAFDPTLGALVAAWGFGPSAPPAADWRPASRSAITQALQCSGWQRLARNAQGQWLQTGGLQLDLSGIAKGFAVDALLQCLHRLGLTDCLVEIGGELRASGQRPDGQPWRVALAPVAHQPQQTDSAATTLVLREQAVATSGSLYHQHSWQGRSYSHTLDGRSGQPIANGLESVTVLHPRCMDADALASLLTVLGLEDGLAFAQQHGIAALLHNGQEAAASPAWQTAMQQADLPPASSPFP